MWAGNVRSRRLDMGPGRWRERAAIIGECWRDAALRPVGGAPHPILPLRARQSETACRHSETVSHPTGSGGHPKILRAHRNVPSPGRACDDARIETHPPTLTFKFFWGNHQMNAKIALAAALAALALAGCAKKEEPVEASQEAA